MTGRLILPGKMQNESVISSYGNNLAKKPEDNEIEVSVLGPGYGECILLHLGKNNWIIVDSCVFPGYSYPAPLLYLDKMNVDYDAVEAIIATHWHDDHFKGLSNILKACKKSEFICSGSLKNDEFLELVEIYGGSSIARDSGINEFKEILSALIERKDKGEKNYIPKFAVADRSLWHNTIEDNGNNISITLHSLSPSDAAMFSAKLDIKNYLPIKSQYPRAIPAISSNHASVVLWLSFGDISILLGADLEEEGNPYKGWSVIIDSETRPNGKAIFYKIAHHGSINAYHPRIWDDMPNQIYFVKIK
jgi:hypothetical protein